MPLKHILKNKLLLQKHFNTNEYSMDNWAYWLFEENISLANEIMEDDEAKSKESEENQRNNMPNIDTNSMMKNVQNMTSNIPKF